MSRSGLPPTKGQVLFSQVHSLDDISISSSATSTTNNKNNKNKSSSVFKTASDVQLLLEGIPPNVVWFNQQKIDTFEKIEALLPRCPETLIHVEENRKTNDNFEAALLACACLKLGFPQSTFKSIGLMRLYVDDGKKGNNKKKEGTTPFTPSDAFICFFEIEGIGFGAISTNQQQGVRYRDPVYPSLRDLVLSYLPNFINFNTISKGGKKWLRGYSDPLFLWINQSRRRDREENEEKNDDEDDDTASSFSLPPEFENWERSDEAALCVKQSLCDMNRRMVIPLLSEEQVSYLTVADERAMLACSAAFGYKAY